MSKKEKKQKHRRKWYFRFLLKLMKKRYPKPQFIYLGEEVQDGSLIISNHEGTDAPLSLEMYLGKNVTKRACTITRKNTGTCIWRACFA